MELKKVQVKPGLCKDFKDSYSPIVEMPSAHEDARGFIQPLVDESMQSAVIIVSKKGTVRANHYHLTDWHYCYVLSGSIDYYWRPAKSKDKPKCVTIKPKQLFFTPPDVEHAMHFTEDTEFLCLGGNPRAQESYEADVRRVEVFNPES
jgi:dTDP-4-dehydrorhamnose 3,5-epimerase-like enzyme